MTRDEIYDHLAQVYLGKRKKNEIKEKKQFNAWLLINIFITIVIFASAFYGLTAFLVQKKSLFQNNIIYSLNRGPIHMDYNFRDANPPLKSFTVAVPPMDASAYKSIEFAIRAKEEGSPGILKVVIQNKRNEVASYYVRGIDYDWKNVHIPLDEFYNITDWSTLTDVTFVLESWNVDNKKGLVLIENINFSS